MSRRDCRDTWAILPSLEKSLLPKECAPLLVASAFGMEVRSLTNHEGRDCGSD